jgi:hypothetical protein
MASSWADVDALIHELGAVCAAATLVSASDADKAGIKSAIGEATQAVVGTLDTPEDAETIGQARQAIAVARELVAGLAAEIERARRARKRAADLGVRRPYEEGESN